jgi:hypothetical protein
MKSNSSNMQGGVLKDPPQTLILNRKYIQQLPNNQKVVIYHCPNLKRDFSLLYTKTGLQLSESEFSIVEVLRNLKEVETVQFNDGSEINIDEECSLNILKLYDSLEEGHKDMEEYLTTSENNFLKVLKYSVTKFKQET